MKERTVNLNLKMTQIGKLDTSLNLEEAAKF